MTEYDTKIEDFMFSDIVNKKNLTIFNQIKQKNWTLC